MGLFAIDSDYQFRRIAINIISVIIVATCWSCANVILRLHVASSSIFAI